jgi:hypothetical protein
MDIKRNGSRPSTKAPEAYFSGAVRVEPVFQVGDPVRFNGGSVTFEPGARTAWHTHPLGQTLIHHGRSWLGANRRRTDRRSPAGRCGGVVPARREALARRNANHRP